MNEYPRSLVRGYVWRCTMWNGAKFEYWTPSKITKTSARFRLLDEANGSYTDDPPYVPRDIVSLWQTKGGQR